MAVLLSPAEILRQSEGVIQTFGETKWKPYAKINAKLPQRNLEELRNSGIGKFMVCAVMGQSLEEQVELIKKYRDRIIVTTNDKCFGPLLEHGVKADYVMLCDCNVEVKHLLPYVEETKGVTLLSSPYGNVDWTTIWKGDRYFYINRDAVFSELIFKKIFGEDVRTIPASSNVSNAMVVFWTGSDEFQNINWGGFERYLLVGYDYSWRPTHDGGHYYAWNDIQPKRFYMQHRTMLDGWKNVVFTSENLVFSAKWLESYITVHRLPVVNCSGRGLLRVNPMDFEDVLRSICQDKSFRERCRENFVVAKLAQKCLDAAMRNFDKSREELLCPV